MTLHRVVLVCVVGMGAVGGVAAAVAEDERVTLARAAIQARLDAVETAWGWSLVEWYVQPAPAVQPPYSAYKVFFSYHRPAWREEGVLVHPHVEGTPPKPLVRSFDGQMTRTFVVGKWVERQDESADQQPETPPWWDLRLDGPEAVGGPSATFLAAPQLRHVGQEELAGLQCLVFATVDGAPGRARRWWIAPERGWGVVKEESVSAAGAAFRDVEIVDAWEQVGPESWFPAVKRLVRWRARPGGEEVALLVRSVTTDYHLNEDDSLLFYRHLGFAGAEAAFPDDREPAPLGPDERPLLENPGTWPPTGALLSLEPVPPR